MKVLCVFLAVTAALILYICAVFCAKTKTEIEYKSDSLRIRIRSRVFRYTFCINLKHERGENPPKSVAADNDKKSRGNNRRERKSFAETFLKKHRKSKKTVSEAVTAEGFFQKLRRLKKAYSVYKAAAEIFLKELRGKVRLSDIRAELNFGTGNAASTGMLYGVFWGMYGALYAYIRKFLNFERPKLKINADFKQKIFVAEACGIITVRPVHIIFAAAKAYSAYKRETGKTLKDILRNKGSKNINTESENHAFPKGADEKCQKISTPSVK